MGAAGSASCFGPAYEMAMILDTDLRRVTLRNGTPVRKRHRGLRRTWLAKNGNGPRKAGRCAVAGRSGDAQGAVKVMPCC